jgi:hypothetical protein
VDSCLPDIVHLDVTQCPESETEAPTQNARRVTKVFPFHIRIKIFSLVNEIKFDIEMNLLRHSCITMNILEGIVSKYGHQIPVSCRSS